MLKHLFIRSRTLRIPHDFPWDKTLGIFEIGALHTMHFDGNEFDDFSFEDVNIDEVFDEMGRQLIDLWLDLRRTKVRVLELEMRYGMHNDNDIHQMGLF